MENRTMIIGSLGQLGSYLGEMLSSAGQEYIGIVRPETGFRRILDNAVNPIRTLALDILDKKTLYKAIEEFMPTHIYNFAGISNVFSPFSDVDTILDTNTRIPQNTLEAIKDINKDIRFFQASSCLIFGGTPGIKSETSPRAPIYPYGASKVYADTLVQMYREEFGIFACSGILFNNESPRRGDRFFSKKVANAARNREKIMVGNLDSQRDYGYAGDFVEAIYLMMNATSPQDYIIGTGKLTSMRDFAKKCFETQGLDYREYLVETPALFRKESQVQWADITKIKNNLNWEPKTQIDGLVSLMMR